MEGSHEGYDGAPDLDHKLYYVFKVKDAFQSEVESEVEPTLLVDGALYYISQVPFVISYRGDSIEVREPNYSLREILEEMSKASLLVLKDRENRFFEYLVRVAGGERRPLHTFL